MREKGEGERKREREREREREGCCIPSTAPCCIPFPSDVNTNQRRVKERIIRRRQERRTKCRPGYACTSTVRELLDCVTQAMQS